MGDKNGMNRQGWLDMDYERELGKDGWAERDGRQETLGRAIRGRRMTDEKERKMRGVRDERVLVLYWLKAA
jgi:hypothetical protein